jgi:RNase P/RNase MRP subunit POP5
LAMIKYIDNMQVILHTVGTSGILKKAKTRL